MPRKKKITPSAAAPAPESRSDSKNLPQTPIHLDDASDLTTEYLNTPVAVLGNSLARPIGSRLARPIGSGLARPIMTAGTPETFGPTFRDLAPFANNAALQQSATATGAGGEPGATKAPAPRNRTAAKVLAIIRKQPIGKGIQGKGIIKELKTTGTELAESTLRRHIIKDLVDNHGVISD